MNNSFFKDFELSRAEKEKWARHFFLTDLYERGVEIEEIAKIAGLSEKEIDELFPLLNMDDEDI